VRTTAFPTANHVVALGDEVRRSPELEVRERRAELYHEIPYVIATATGCMQRILKKHIRRREFVDDLGFQGLPRKPSNQRPTIALLSCSRDIFDPLSAVKKNVTTF
jgi:hypothetical protein